MDVRVGGRGRTTRADLIGRRSSRSSSSPVTGSFPFSSMYFSIRRFSKTVPVFFETTGSSGASPETVADVFYQQSFFDGGLFFIYFLGLMLLTSTKHFDAWGLMMEGGRNCFRSAIRDATSWLRTCSARSFAGSWNWNPRQASKSRLLGAGEIDTPAIKAYRDTHVQTKFSRPGTYLRTNQQLPVANFVNSNLTF